MRILFLAHRIPYPPNKGDKIRSYHMLRYLANRHDVDLASLLDERSDAAFVDNVKSFVREFVFQPISPRLRKILSFFSILQSKAISPSFFYSSQLQKDIDVLIQRHEPEVVFCFSSPMAEYVFRSKHANGSLRRAVRIMDLIDVDSYKWAQYGKRSRGLKRWVYRYEAKHLAHYEETIAATFDHVLVVSEQEKQILSNHVALGNVEVVTNGVDLGYFAPMGDGRASGGPNIVFTGVMDYLPNVEGVIWFAREIFPMIRRKVPSATFWIVGAKPTGAVNDLARLPGVRVTGFVKDIRDYLAIADVCVVPLRIARGVQNKVLEAMAMGKAVVSTPQALDGINAVSGEEVLCASSEAGFVSAVLSLLENREEAEGLGRRARLRVERFYSWDENLGVLEEMVGVGGHPLEKRLSH